MCRMSQLVDARQVLPQPLPPKMKKRSAGTNPASSCKVRKTTKQTGPLPAVDCKVLKGWAVKILQHYQDTIGDDKFHDIEAYIDATIGNTAVARMQFISEFEQAAARDPNITYSGEVDRPGAKYLRLWMLSYSKDAGTKGLMLDEEASNLISLILRDGFITNADTMPGYEKLIVTGIDNITARPDTQHTTFPVDGYSLGMHSVGEIKGWSRISSALFIWVAGFELGLTKEMAADAAWCSTFATVHAITPAKCLTTEEQIFHSREASCRAYTHCMHVSRKMGADHSIMGTSAGIQDKPMLS